MPDDQVRNYLSDGAARRLARDIARDLIAVPDLMKIHQLTVMQYEQLINSRSFQTYLDEEICAWVADPKNRIRNKALIILEAGLEEVYDLIHDRTQSMANKVEALKFLGRLAHMEPGAGGAIDPSDRVIFNITIGSQKLHYEQQREDPKMIDAEVTQLGNQP